MHFKNKYIADKYIYCIQISITMYHYLRYIAEVLYLLLVMILVRQ